MAWQVEGSIYSTCAITAAATVECWGDGEHGALGDGTGLMHHASSPIAVSGLSGVTDLAGGDFFWCALVAGGQVRCWGANGSGQLGNGTTLESSVPVTVTGISGATAISAGGEQACAVVAGTVRCWGNDQEGQLGDGTTSNTSTPVQAVGVSGATDVAVGHYHSCALVSGGSVSCWGSASFGQLGDGVYVGRSTAAPVSGLTGATQLVSGYFHTCALVGGTVRCWGYDLYGQLGDNSVATDSPSPTMVVGMSSAVRLAANEHTTCAVSADGTVSCWGHNESGQVGTGTTSTRVPTPSAVAGISGASDAGVGVDHACAVSSGSTVRCWGSNASGQLGDGTTTDSYTPVTAATF